MSATKSTTHYKLPSFLGSDKPAWLVDWNGAMATIDSAIYEAKQAADAAGTSATAVASDLATLSGTVSTQGSTISTLSETLTTAVGNINTINSLIGNGTPTTTDQTIIGAINEINANVGDPADASSVTGDDAFEKIETLNASLTNNIYTTNKSFILPTNTAIGGGQAVTITDTVSLPNTKNFTAMLAAYEFERDWVSIEPVDIQCTAIDNTNHVASITVRITAQNGQATTTTQELSFAYKLAFI